MKKCGITGHTGLVGKNLIKSKKFKFIKFKGDIRNKKDIRKWLSNKNLDAIIHLAAVVPIVEVNKDYEKAKKINYFGTKNLIDVIIEEKKSINWFFFASSSHVYNFKNKKILLKESSITNPFSKYGYTKLLAERYIKSKLGKLNIPYCIGRIFSIIDPQQSKSFFFPSVLNRVKSAKGKIYFKNLGHIRDFLTLYDITEAIFHLYKKKCKGIFNIASGKELSLISIVNQLCKIYKKQADIKLESKMTYAIADIKKIKKTGWKPKRKVNIRKIILKKNA